MNTQYTFKNMQRWESSRIKEYMDTKERSLSRLLSHFQEDEVRLEVHSERFDKNNAYEVELCMELPGKLLVGKEASHSIEKAIDLAKDRLMSQLRKHKQTVEDRAHGGIGALPEEKTYKRAFSSEVESNPM